MTLFSYLISKYENKNFSEPQILGQLIKRLPNSCTKFNAQKAGWCTHYLIGFLFVRLYSELWERKKIDPSLSSGALLGAVSGVAGVIAWKSIIEIHPSPPAIDQKTFFGQLVAAHIVFGVFSALTYKLVLNEKKC